MKKFINNADDFLNESLNGFAKAHEDIIKVNFDPNFVTRKKIEGDYIYLDKLKNIRKLDNKIIVIENADPGYDWIFAYKILGLVTKFGGINSHMAIRCS